jgi:hypothetical protein
MHPLETFWTRAEAPWWLSLVTLLIGAAITGFVTWMLDRQRREAERETRTDDRLEAERTLQRERARSEVIALLVTAEQVRLETVDEYNKTRDVQPPSEQRAAILAANNRLARYRAPMSEQVQSLIISSFSDLKDAAQRLADASRVDLGMIDNQFHFKKWNDELVDAAKVLRSAASHEFSPESVTGMADSKSRRAMPS